MKAHTILKITELALGMSCGFFRILLYFTTNKSLVKPTLKVNMLMKANEKIRFIREMKQWSQEEVADKLSMSTNGYAKLERGETKLNIPRLEQIAEVFGIELEELLSVNEKSVICLLNENSTNCSNYYEGSTQLASKVEQLKQELAHAKEIIKMKDTEIENLKTIIELSKK